MTHRFPRFCCLISFLLALFISSALKAQSFENYTPRKTFDEDSRDLLNYLQTETNRRAKEIPPPYSAELKEIYKKSSRLLSLYIRNKSIVNDDSLQKFVDVIYAQLLKYNTIKNRPTNILILKSAATNAVSLPQGTILVYIGLLSKIADESELAFTIAHEMAHYELEHSRKHLIEVKKIEQQRKEQNNTVDFSKDQIDPDDLAALRSAMFKAGQFKREIEVQADSLGFAFFKNAHYAQQEAISLLSLLDSKNTSDAEPDFSFFMAFDLDEYPPKEKWFKKRPSLYNKEVSNTYLFNFDSLRAHPEIEMRQSVLHTFIEDFDLPVNQQNQQFVSNCLSVAKFEAVGCAFENKKYDECLYRALKLNQSHPHHRYIISTITAVLINKAVSKEPWTILPARTAGYSEEQRLVNDFLNNIESGDLLDLAYYFLKNNFDESSKEHHYILWRVSALTGRDDEKKQIKANYRERFGKDAYYNVMN